MAGGALFQVFVVCALSSQAFSFKSHRAAWGVVVDKLCLEMTDASYSQVSSAADQDLSEEVIVGRFGDETLYCKRGCCGDNRNPVCCIPDDDVGQAQFATYKLITVIAAGVGGLAIIAVVSVFLVKRHLKKRRLVRDIQALNCTNGMTDINGSTKVSAIGGGGVSGQKDSKKDKKKKSKKEKLFTSSKKAPVVQVAAAPTDLHPPSYATLNIQTLHTSEPATRAVGDLPVFLPNSPGVLAASQTSAVPVSYPPADGSYRMSSLNTSANMAPTRAEASLANVFSTPLADNPQIFSGPYDKSQASSSTNSQKASPSPSSSEKRSGKKSSSPGAAKSSPLPQIPWDDADLDIYLSEIQDN